MNVQKASTQGSTVVENAAKRLRAFAANSTQQITVTSAKQAKACSMKSSKGERRARKGVAFRMFTAAALAASLCFGTVASAFGDDPASANEAAQETPATNVENAATTEAPSNIEMINTTTRLENGGSGNTITGTVSMSAYTDVFQVDGVTYRSIFSPDEQAALQVEPQAAIIGLTDDQLGAESIEIPATVSSAGNEYKVVALGERAATQARNAADPNADASIKDMHLLGNGAGAAGISAKNPALEKLLLPDSLTYIDVDALAVFQSLKTIEVNVGNPVFAGHMGTLLMTNDFEQSVQDAEGVTVAYIPSAMRNVELPEHATGIFSEAAPYAKGVAGFHVPEANTHLTSTADLLLRSQEDDTLAVALRAAAAGTATVIPETATLNDQALPVTTIDAGAFSASAVQLSSIVSPAVITSIAAQTTVVINDEEQQNTPPAFEQATVEKATVALVSTDEEATAVWAEAGFTSFTQIGQAGSQETLESAGGSEVNENGQISGSVQLQAPDEQLVPGTATAGLTFTLLPDMTVEVGWSGRTTFATSLNIPSSAFIGDVAYPVSSIAKESFRGSPIQSLTLPASLRTIGESAFEGTTQLQTVDLGTSLRTIGYAAFKDSGLSEIWLPETLQAVGGEAFANCSNLTKIVARGSVSTVAETALTGCTGVTILVPDAQETSSAWNAAKGLIVSNNRVVSYSISLPVDPLTLEQGSAGNIFSANMGVSSTTENAGSGTNSNGSADNAQGSGAAGIIGGAAASNASASNAANAGGAQEMAAGVIGGASASQTTAHQQAQTVAEADAADEAAAAAAAAEGAAQLTAQQEALDRAAAEVAERQQLLRQAGVATDYNYSAQDISVSTNGTVRAYEAGDSEVTITRTLNNQTLAQSSRQVVVPAAAAPEEAEPEAQTEIGSATYAAPRVVEETSTDEEYINKVFGPSVLARMDGDFNIYRQWSPNSIFWDVRRNPNVDEGQQYTLIILPYGEGEHVAPSTTGTNLAPWQVQANLTTLADEDAITPQSINNVVFLGQQAINLRNGTPNLFKDMTGLQKVSAEHEYTLYQPEGSEPENPDVPGGNTENTENPGGNTENTENTETNTEGNTETNTENPGGTGEGEADEGTGGDTTGGTGTPDGRERRRQQHR